MSGAVPIDVKEEPEFLYKALDFSNLIEEKQHAHFPGTREWLFSAVRVWLKSTKRLFWVVGDAGTGKSVISAKLFQMSGVKEHIVAWHFCRHDNAAASEVKVLLMSWAAMMSKILPGFQLVDLSKNLSSVTAVEVFEQLIGGPLSRMPPPPTPCVIILDALDELPKDSLLPVLGLIANVFDSLPNFMRLFVTSRNQKDIVKHLAKFDSEKLLVDDVRNKADLRAYLAHVAREHLELELTTAALEKLLEKQFNLPGETLKGQLSELESLIEQSKFIYGHAAAEFQTLPDYRHTRNIQDVKPDFLPMQQATTIEELFVDAGQAHLRLVESFDKGKKEKWVEKIIDPGLKTVESAARKVRDDYNGNPRLLKDLVRFTGEFMDCSCLNGFLEKFRVESKDFQLIALRNKHANPTSLGYRDFNLTLLVNLEGGRSHLCELQVNLKPMLDAKEKAHLHYELIRVSIPAICAAANILDRGRFEHYLTSVFDNSLLESAVAELENKAGGLFLYATLLAQQLQQDQKEGAKLDFAKLYGLPTGLGEIYQENFDRLVGADESSWKVFVPVIALIVAAREPLLQTLAELVLGPSLEDVQNSLSMLFPVRDGCFQVMHKSVVDWLRDTSSSKMYSLTAADLQSAHVALSKQLLKHLQEKASSLYPLAMRQAVYHLCEGGMANQAFSLLTDFSWVLERAKLTPAGLLADSELVANTAGAHQAACKLLHSVLQNSWQEWSKDYQRLPGQLVGRLLAYEANPHLGLFLKQVRKWVGPLRGWWCVAGQSMPPAGGPEVSVFKLSDDASCIRWSPDRKFVAWISTKYAYLRVTNVQNGEHTTFNGDIGGPLSVIWSPDGKMICHGSTDNKIRIWDVESVTCIKTLEGHTSIVYSVSWSKDGKKVCSGSKDCSIRIWGVESGSCLKNFRGHYEMIVKYVCWSNDDKKVFGCCEDHTMHIWDAEGGLIKTFNRGMDRCRYVSEASWSIDDKKIATGGEDETLRIWDVESGQCIKIFGGHEGFVKAMCWSSDGKRVCSAADTIRIWDEESGKLLKIFEGHSSSVDSMIWDDDEKRILSCSRDCTARVWDVENKQEATKLKGHTRRVISLCWSGDKHKVCSLSYDKTIRLWDMESGESQIIAQHTQEADSLSWTSDGEKLCSGSNGEVYIWDVKSGENVKTLTGHHSIVRTVSWTSDGKRICSGDTSNTVYIWDVESGQRIKTLEGHTGDILTVCWSSDGKRVCSGSKDRTIRIWDVESGECLKILKGHTNQVELVRWTSDEKKVCSYSFDGTVRVWDVETSFSFRTRLLNSSFRRPHGGVRFAEDVSVEVHPLNPSRAIGKQHATLHCMHRLGVDLPPSNPVELVERSDVKTCQKCDGAEAKHQERCIECLHRTWCLLNLVELPPGLEEDEEVGRQELELQKSKPAQFSNIMRGGVAQGKRMRGRMCVCL